MEDNSNVKLVSEVAKLQQPGVHYPTSAQKDPKSTGAVNGGGSTQISAFKPVVKDGVSPFRTNRSSSFGNPFHSKAGGIGMNNTSGSSHNVHNVSSTNIASGTGQPALAQSATKASSQTRGAGNFFTGLQSFNRGQQLLKPDPGLIVKLLNNETDERYRYLVRHGNLHYVEADTLTLYVELKQIPNIMIIYRRPSERANKAEKLALENRGFKHIPLLEGEEKLKFLNLQLNEITKIDNLVSLPNLTFLDLSQNKLTEIN